ncbi:hypothetical protein SDC9_192334 [bioreactor metagenome]|uniref:Swarming motility protein SwrD n=1 Tax=bioreactor metagenome TaxID=1076179 RepID=A0A645I2X1_9ZZZZ
MIELTKMNDEKFFINPNLIEIIENTPDTLITTMSGKKYYVLESVQEVSVKVMEYYQKINMRKAKTKTK